MPAVEEIFRAVIVEAGQPCGDSFIADDHECHVGQGDPAAKWKQPGLFFKPKAHGAYKLVTPLPADTHVEEKDKAEPVDPAGVLAFKPGDAVRPTGVNGRRFETKPEPPDYANIKDVPGVDTIGLPPLKPWQHPASGVVIMEPDGRVWVVAPKGGYGGYDNTFPKGTVEEADGLTLQQNAHKEAFEESGLKVRIKGLVGDFEGDTSMTRYYLAERTGGSPYAHDGNETAAVKLATLDELRSMLNKKRDRRILKAVEERFSKAAIKVAAASPRTLAESGTKKLAASVLRRLTQVNEAWLEPVKPVFLALAAKARDQQISDADFIAAITEAEAKLPLLFDRLDTAVLQEAMADAMASGMANGVAGAAERAVAAGDGVPCGDSHIAAEKTCRLGEGAAPAAKPEIRPVGTGKSRKGWLLKQGAPEEPPESTPAHDAWFREHVVWDKATGASRREKEAADLVSGDKDLVSKAERDIAERKIDAEGIASATALGFKPRGELETETQFRERLEAERKNPVSPFGEQNPEKSHLLDYKGRAKDIKAALWASWTMSNQYQDVVNAHLYLKAGKDAATVMADQKVMRENPTSYSLGEYWFANEEVPQALKDEVRQLEEARAAHSKTKWDYAKPSAERKVAGEQERVLSEKISRLVWHDQFKRDAQNRVIANLEPSLPRALEQLRTEAVASLKADKPVFRGINLTEAKAAEIEAAIAEKGFYDLPERAAGSWTLSERMAQTFAKHGQGKQSRDWSVDGRFVGMVMQSVVTKANVIAHPDQPTYKKQVAEWKATGQKFHSGGADQKEVVVANPDGYIRLTKDNVKFIRA